MLITGAVTLVTWLVTLVTHPYMRKNGGEAFWTGRCWSELETRRLKCAVRWHLCYGFPISYVVDRLLDRALLE